MKFLSILLFVILAFFKADAQPVLVKDIAPGSASSYDQSYVSQIRVVGGKLMFEANDNTHGNEIWVSDGTSDGTVLVKDINPGTNDGAVGKFFIAFKDRLYFLGNNSANGWEAWVTDGTEAGTSLFRDATPGPDYSYFYDVSAQADNAEFVEFQDKLFLLSANGSDQELYVSNGKPDSVVLFADLVPGSMSGAPDHFFVHGGKLYFSGPGAEPWISDGTVAGTKLLKDVNPGFSGSAPERFISLGSTVFFLAETANEGVELWKTDGTEAGTVLVKDIRPGTGGAFPGPSFRSLVVLGNKLLFSAGDATAGTELWVTDGTTNGTILLKDIRPGVGGSFPILYGKIGNTLLFSAETSAQGVELWITDGTAANTKLLKDIYPDFLSSNISRDYAIYNGKMFFGATGSSNGNELWRTDGTAAGTVQLADINLQGNSSPSGFTVLNDVLYFFADDGVNGRELWKLDLLVSATEPSEKLMAADVSPNPNKGDFQVSLPDDNPSGEKRVVLFDAIGRRALDQKCPDDGSSKISIRAGNLPVGIYRALILTSDKTYSTPVIIQR